MVCRLINARNYFKNRSKSQKFLRFSTSWTSFVAVHGEVAFHSSSIRCQYIKTERHLPGHLFNTLPIWSPFYSIELSLYSKTYLNLIFLSSASRFAHLTSTQPQYTRLRIANMLSGQEIEFKGNVQSLCFCLLYQWTFNNSITGYSKLWRLSLLYLISITHNEFVLNNFVQQRTTWRWFIPLALFYCLRPTVGGKELQIDTDRDWL